MRRHHCQWPRGLPEKRGRASGRHATRHEGKGEPRLPLGWLRTLRMATAQITSSRPDPLVERAERLWCRLRLASHEAGLASGKPTPPPKAFEMPALSSPASSASSSSASSNAPAMTLYESLFGRHFQLEPLHEQKHSAPVMRLVSPPQPLTSPRLHARTASERLALAASSPQHGNDLHKRRRLAAAAPASFQFPPRSSLAQGLGIAPHTRRRLPAARAGHARIASMPEQRHEHYVPVRGQDPVPDMASLHPAADAMLRLASTPAVQTPRSHVRTQSRDDQDAMLLSPAARTHRRSISHSTAELNVPVSHDRTSGMTTPPAGVAALPVTPKSMGSQSMSYGDYLIMSPSPRPRMHPPRHADTLPVSPLRQRAWFPDTPGRRGVRPLWAQPPR